MWALPPWEPLQFITSPPSTLNSPFQHTTQLVKAWAWATVTELTVSPSFFPSLLYSSPLLPLFPPSLPALHFLFPCPFLFLSSPPLLPSSPPLLSLSPSLPQCSVTAPRSACVPLTSPVGFTLTSNFTPSNTQTDEAPATSNKSLATNSKIPTTCGWSENLASESSAWPLILWHNISCPEVIQHKLIFTLCLFVRLASSTL